jgi:hypothetical protein
MDTIQNCDSYINIPLSQNYTSSLFKVYTLLSFCMIAVKIYV